MPSESIDRLMDPQVEREVLACCAVDDPSVFSNVRAVLGEEDFTLEANRRIYRALCHLVAAGRPLTTTEIYNACQEMRLPVELSYLIGTGVFFFALEGYLRRLRELSIRRRLVLRGAQLQQDAIDLTLPLDDLSARTSAAMAEAWGDSVAEQMPEDVQGIIEAAGGTEAFLRTAPGIRSPWPELDKFTGGWQRGELILIGARPSMGKTALALNALMAAAIAGTPSVFYSFEMTRDAIVKRLICLRVGISYRELEDGHLDASTARSVNEAIGWLNTLPLKIIGASGRNALAIRVHAERLANRKQCGFILVDYIGLVKSSDPDGNRSRELGEVCRQLKETAVTLAIPAIVLAQLNRQATMREDKRPGLPDLRDSGELEEHADLVAFLHRPGYYNRADPALERVAELIVAKQRNGDTPIINLDFHRRCGRFEDPATRPVEEEKLWV